MGLLDWIKERNETAPKVTDVSKRCTASYEKQARGRTPETMKEKNDKTPLKREKSRDRGLSR